MLNKALDLLRTIGWSIVNFIYSLIDSLFDILKEINALDIVNSVSDESMFQKMFSGILAISVALLGLFSIWNFVKKIIDPEEEKSTEQIVKEIVKCGILVIISTFLFAQSSDISIKLSNYTSTVASSNGISIADNMLIGYVDYTEAYESSEDFAKEDYTKYIKNDSFTNKKLYNDKFVTDSKWILPDEEEYKYSINWIMAILVGGFFLYALVFSGMMLAKRQIEFLFLFIISPVVFATSVGNKERRQALFQQLVSLILQGAVVMLIIGLTAILMKSIQGTTFFPNSIVKDIVIKSILYIGCAVFLMTGSQAANRFIGSNVAANSGREALMSMRGFSSGLKTGVATLGVGALGAGLVGAGAISSGAGNAGGNKLAQSIGGSISTFGKKISGSSPVGSSKNSIGNMISKFGSKMQTNTPSSIGKSLRSSGYREISDAISTMNPIKNTIYRNYSRRKD